MENLRSEEQAWLYPNQACCFLSVIRTVSVILIESRKLQFLTYVPVERIDMNDSEKINVLTDTSCISSSIVKIGLVVSRPFGLLTSTCYCRKYIVPIKYPHNYVIQ